MKKIEWLILVPGLVLAGLAVVLIMLMSLSTPMWACNCDGNDKWSYVGPDGLTQSSAHFDDTRHSTSCKRTDSVAEILDKISGIIFHGHEV